jgi:hypothetical protein
MRTRAIGLPDTLVAVDESPASDAARGARSEPGPVHRSSAGQLRRYLREMPPDPEYWDDIRFVRALPARTPSA